MDWIESKTKLKNLFQKYKYVFLIIILGVLLMVIPGEKTDDNTAATAVTELVAEKTLSEQLKDILQQIKGAGRVEVILTEASGEQYIYQTNDDTDTDSDHTSRSTDTVLVTDSQRNQSGLVSTIVPPIYMGAIVVCQGADDPSVKLAIVDAVSKATGLGSDKISVLKMK